MPSPRACSLFLCACPSTAFLDLWLPSLSLTTGEALLTMDDPQRLLPLKMCISYYLQPLGFFPLLLLCSSLSTIYLFLKFTSLTLIFGLIFLKLNSIPAIVYLYDHYGILIIYCLLLPFLLSSKLLWSLMVKILKDLALYPLHVCCMELYLLLLDVYVQSFKYVRKMALYQLRTKFK